MIDKQKIRELAEKACFDEIGKDYSLYFNLTKEKVEVFAALVWEEAYEKGYNEGYRKGNDDGWTDAREMELG